MLQALTLPVLVTEGEKDDLVLASQTAHILSMSEPQVTRVEVLGRAFVVYGGKVIGYLTPQEITQLQKLAAATRSAGVTWQEYRPLISYCPEGLGKLGKRIIETHAICSRCGHQAWAPGAGRRSTASACVMLRLGCPRGESNFYFEQYPLSTAREEWRRGKSGRP